MTPSLEALEKAAKAAREVGEPWLTHDDLTGVYPETMAFIVEASPSVILSLLSAHRAAMEKVERYEKTLSNLAQADYPRPVGRAYRVDGLASKLDQCPHNKGDLYTCLTQTENGGMVLA